MSAIRRPARDLWPNGEPSIIFLKPPQGRERFSGVGVFLERTSDFGLRTSDFGVQTSDFGPLDLEQKK